MESIRELRKICARSQKYHTSPLYARKVIRHISIYITWLFLHTRITPNQITFLGMLVGLAGGVCLAFQKWIIGIILLQISYILDCVDGEVARYKKISSLSGEHLDMIGHFFVQPCVYFCFSVGLYQEFTHLWILILGFLGALCSGPIVTSALDHVVMNIVRSGRIKDYQSGVKSQKSGVRSQKLEVIKLLKRIKRALTIPIGYPNTFNIITGAVIIDLLVSKFGVTELGFNLKLLFLIYLGLYTPVGQIIGAFQNVRKKQIERDLSCIK
ncbi:CDP-alcohol phosphatidyltransferase family protein [candidate division WOR-3 bacterium]|nr:CDP-alcohol phosphatidyltransferase family protein [candidate division WOR-3 bacterium]